jgi:hypothetical protein
MSDGVYKAMWAKAEAARKEAEAARKEAEAARKEAEAATEKEKAAREKAEEKLKENVHCLETSIRSVYISASDPAVGHVNHAFRAPALVVNKQVGPSVSGHKYGTTRGEDKKRKPLEAKITHIANVLPLLEARSFPVKDNEGNLVTSDFGSRKKPLTYVNEADIQNYVVSLVRDAITVLGLRGKCETHMEMSLFSNVPDIVVVRTRGRVVLCIEVKSPEHKPGQVFGSGIVAYQMYSYLMVMKQLGYDAPVACLSTYNSICMATLNNPTTDSSFKDDMNVVAKQLSRDKIQHQEDAEDFTQKKPKNGSPIRSVVRLVGQGNDSHTHTDSVNATKAFEDHPETRPPALSGSFLAKGTDSLVDSQSANADDLVGDYEDQATVLPPAVIYGPPCAASEVFQTMCKILLFAHCRCQRLDHPDWLPVVHHGDDLGGRVYPRVDETCCVWVKTPESLRANAREFPQNRDTTPFLLLTPLGQGSAGKVFLACTSSGLLCAVKLYIPDRSTRYSHEDREQDMMQRMEEKGKRRDLEFDRWKTLYGRSGSGKRQKTGSEFSKFRKTKLNGLPALLLPYGKQLETAQERWDAIGEIREMLEHFAENGYSYKDTDLRWRHVARCSKSKKLLLLDLESLEEEDATDEQKKEWVRKQMEELTRRLNP